MLYINQFMCTGSYSLRWRDNGRDSVSNHQPHDCLLNCSCRRSPKKTSKLRVIGLCAGNSPGVGTTKANLRFPSFPNDQNMGYIYTYGLWGWGWKVYLPVSGYTFIHLVVQLSQIDLMTLIVLKSNFKIILFLFVIPLWILRSYSTGVAKF